MPLSDCIRITEVGPRDGLQNEVEVVSTDTDRGLILIRGAVPGSKGAWILVRDAAKVALPDAAPKPGGIRAAAAKTEAAATEGAE